MIDRLLARRTRFPTFLNRLIDFVADHPTGPVGRLVALRFGRPPRGEPSPASTPPTTATRVLIAPVNYSGQARRWAEALQANYPGVGAVNMAVEVPGGFDFPSDVVVPLVTYHNGKSWQRAQLAAAERFTHILIEAEEPIFGRLLSRDVQREVRHLLDRGVDVAFIAHGTDIRQPSMHRERTPWSPYRDPDLYVARLEELARRNRRIIESIGRPAFVSTPDLLADLPGAMWCPVAIDPRAWHTPRRRQSDALRVVHAPSSNVMKGTSLIEPVVYELEERRRIRYRRVERTPAAQMPEVFAEADVVLDQFRLGSYGVAACEAMAAGAVVVGHVVDEVRDSVRRLTGMPLPIVEANPDTLAAVLDNLAEDADLVQEASANGREFVATVHDGRASAAALMSGWIQPHGAG